MKKLIIITSIVMTASVTALCFNKAESQSEKKTEVAKIEKIKISNDNNIGDARRADVASAD